MGRASNTKEFISRSNITHNHKYDYTKTIYTKSNIKVCIICPYHGSFYQNPSSHTRGHGCKKCSNDALTYTNSSFIECAIKIHGNKYIYNNIKYTGSHNKICIICPVHGEFWQEPGMHLHGNGCPKCNNEKKSEQYKFNSFEFIKKSKSKHGSEYDYSNVEYNGYYSNVCIICPNHGDFYQTPSNHLAGSRCPKCAKISGSEKLRLTIDEFIKRSIRIHGNIYDYSNTEYISYKDNVEIRCKKHGIFKQLPCNHLSGSGCSKCADYGFDKSLPAILYYLMVDADLFKIGITNLSIDKRYSATVDRDIICPIAIRRYHDGIDAYIQEQKILLEYDHMKYIGPSRLSSGNSELFKVNILNIPVPKNSKSLWKIKA